MKKVYKIFFVVSLLITLIALIVVGSIWKKTGGDFLGTDFVGGSVLELAFESKINVVDVKAELETITEVSLPTVTASGENSIIIRAKKIDDQTRDKIIDQFSLKFGTLNQSRFDDIGPTVGDKLKKNSLKAVIILLIVIVIYLAIVFRSMSRVLSPWALGVAAIAALLHDLIIPIGVIAYLGAYRGVEISAVFVAAALTILGYSVSDTVVVFDRVRENVIRYGSKEKFADLVHKSIMQTLTRSINTSLTTMLALISIFIFGGNSVKYFALALIIGITSGTYSSIFIASPIVVWWHERSLANKRN